MDFGNLLDAYTDAVRIMRILSRDIYPEDGERDSIPLPSGTLISRNSAQNTSNHLNSFFSLASCTSVYSSQLPYFLMANISNAH